MSLIRARNEDERWQIVLQNPSGFSGEKLELMQEIYESEYTTSWGNRAIANLLYNYERLYADPEISLRVYTRSARSTRSWPQTGWRASPVDAQHPLHLDEGSDAPPG